MAKTVSDGFSTFLSRLTPTTTETEAAKSHRASIESCLRANFGNIRFFRSGSFGNGTSVSGFSDVDYFTVIPVGNLHLLNSDTDLRRVRDVLDARFPRTGVRTSCPAVKVPFNSDTETSEVIPAYAYGANTTGSDIFKIPDCNGGWMQTSPTAHNAYVHEVNKKLNYKVKDLIRFVKAWKFYNNVGVSSFYLEMRVAKWVSTESVIVYDIDIKNFFKHLQDIQFANMQDPMGISGYIVPTLSETKLKDAKSKIDTAVTRSQKARNAGSEKDAMDWWNLVFAGNFPGYY